MKGYTTIFVVAVLAVLLLGLAPVGAQDVPPAEVRVAPANVQVAAGGTVEVAVEVVDVQELYGFDLRLAFDPAVLEVADADPNRDGIQVAFGTFLDPGFVVRNTADNSAGTIEFIMTQLNPTEPKSGTGTLIVVKLAAKGAVGSTPLTTEYAQLAQAGGIEIPAILTSGQVEVVGSTSGQPTGTPIPTQAPEIPIPTAGQAPTGIAPTSASTAIAAPPADTPQPGDTAAPTSTPLPATSEPGAPAPTPLPPSQPVPAATDLAPPSATPLPPPAASPTLAPAEIQPAETVVVQVPSDDTSPPARGSGAERSSDPARVFLLISLVALGLALLVGAIAVALLLVRRGPTSN